MASILVTGATGFIGRHLVPALIAAGHQVIASGTKSKQDLSFDWLEAVEYLPCDLNQVPENPYAYFGRPNHLIHLAWEGLPQYQEPFHFERNLYASYFLIKAMVQGGLKDVTVLGTCFEYGLSNGALSEEMPTAPTNAYGQAKDSLQKFLSFLAKKYPFQLKWVRLFYLYGEGQSKNSILSQLKLAIEQKQPAFNMSGGEQLRDYLPVETVADYLVKIAIHPEFSGIVNCCSGKPLSVRKLVENYLAQNQLSIPLNLGYYPYSENEAMAFWGCTEKLNQILSGP